MEELKLQDDGRTQDAAEKVADLVHSILNPEHLDGPFAIDVMQETIINGEIVLTSSGPLVLDY